VLEAYKPDRPPISFWYHFPADQVAGAAAVKAHVDHLRRYDLDFLKVMNDNGYPHAGRMESVADLAGLGDLKGDEGPFGAQLELLSSLRRELGANVLMASTIFNAWATLRNLIRPPVEHRPPNLKDQDAIGVRIRAMYDRDASAVTAALRTIGGNLARFAARCLSAGADGIYLSVRDDWVDATTHAGLYERIVRATDRAILASVQAGRFNMLHMCGTPVGFDAFAVYPVHVINWADRAAGPAISAVIGKVKPAICAGIDNQVTMPQGTPAQCQAEVRDALRQAGGRPILLAPGCTYDPSKVPDANLRALVDAARS
jgi:uroporphyrinogen decarboxylase